MIEYSGKSSAPPSSSRPNWAAPGFAVSVVLALVSPALSAPPQGRPPAHHELLRLAPGDAGFCVVIQGWREQIANLETSPVAARLATSPFGQAIRNSPEAGKLAAFDELLRKNFKVSWPKLRDEILGDALLLAYTPGPPGKPEAEVGLLLVHVRRPDLLALMLDRLTGMQKNSGDVVSFEPRQYRGFTYFAIRKKNGAEEFYLLQGELLAFTEKEAPLRAVMDRDRDAPSAGISMPPLLGRLRGLGVDKDSVALWVNPRAFDAAVAAKVAAAQGAEAVFLRTFYERYWKLIDGAALSLALGTDAAVRISVQAKTHALPAPAQQMIAETAQPSALWATFPKNALFAAAGRVPWEPVVEAGAEFMTPDARREVQDALERTIGAVLGRDVLPQLLKSLGPDWGVCVTPPESAEKGWLPSLTAVLRLRPGGDGARPVEQRVLDGLDFAAKLTVLGYNSQRGGQLRLRLEPQDGVDVRIIEGGQMPPGLQPAFAWKGGYLVLASTPDAVRRFNPPAQTADTDKSNDAEVPLMRLTLQGWAVYLHNYHAPFSAYLAESYKLSAAEAEARVSKLLQGLALFDSIEVTQSKAPGRATVTVRLRTMPADEQPR